METRGPRRWPVRVGLAAVLSVYLVYSSFGFAHPVLWGHFGHHTGEYLQRAKTSLRFAMVAPATSAGFEFPTKQFYYFHHPIGYHHFYTLAIALFGDHAWLGAVVPALTGLLTLWALFALVRRRWSREVALLAVAVYVGLPILCSFSILTDAMLPTMACSLLLAHAYLEYLDAPSRKWLVIGCVAIVLGGLLMWELYLQSFLYGAFLVVRMLRERKRAARTMSVRDGLTWLFTTGAVAAATMTFHFVFLYLRGMWDDFFHSYAERRGANFHFALDRHALWMDLLYGWPLMVLGVVWLGLFVARAVSGHVRRRDGAVLTFFIINLIYVFAFSEASAIHLYRVFFFSSFFAMALPDLCVELYNGLRWLSTHGRPLPRWLPGLAVAIAITGYFAIETPHAIHNLVESREMMGTHGFGPGYNADYPKQLFAMEVAKRTGPEDFVFVHDNLSRRIEFYYYVDRSNMNIATVAQVQAQLAKHPKSIILMDGYPPPNERKLVYDLLKHHPGYLFDHYLMIDLRSNEPDFHEYVFEAERPSWKWRWFVSHKYPPMHLKEVTTQYAPCVYADIGTPPRKPIPEGAMPPLGKSDLVQCWHNFEVVRGRPAAAEDTRKKLATSLVARDVPLGSIGRVLGMRNIARASGELWLLVDHPPPANLVWRWTLLPVAPKVPTTVPHGEARPNPVGDRPLAESRKGYLYAESLRWNVPAGRYHLTIELAPPTPAPPPPARRPPPPPKPFKPGEPVPFMPPVIVPPPPPPPPPVAAADLGDIDIR